ncbi:MAG: aminoacyl-tRNA hydrolase [Bacteroidota bacterium]|nr:aminoacyl-tRNA hydrolase [Bacteroidota bacterium]
MKYLIIGLGNPGEKYENTRHNIGFKVLDALANASDTFFSVERYAQKATVKYKGRRLILIKPSTYMNLSGKAVKYWIEQENIKPENIIVIVDDLALPFGQIRMKAKGGDGNHNGLIDIINILGHQNFARIRFGIGNDFPKGMQADYVLSPWSEDEKLLLPERIKTVTGAIKSFSFTGAGRTMNSLNKAYNFEAELKKIKESEK